MKDEKYDVEYLEAAEAHAVELSAKIDQLHAIMEGE